MLLYTGSLEDVDATCASHHDEAAVGSGAGCSIRELIALNAILHVVFGDGTFFHVDFAQTAGGSYPDASQVVFDEADDTVVCQSLCRGIMLRMLDVAWMIAERTILRAVPDAVVTIHEDTVRERASIQAVYPPPKADVQLFFFLSRQAKPTEVAAYTREWSFEKAILAM